MVKIIDGKWSNGSYSILNGSTYGKTTSDFRTLGEGVFFVEIKNVSGTSNKRIGVSETLNKGWVSSGNYTDSFTPIITLVAGRVYGLLIDLSDKNIGRLCWNSDGGEFTEWFDIVSPTGRNILKNIRIYTVSNASANGNTEFIINSGQDEFLTIPDTISKKVRKDTYSFDGSVEIVGHKSFILHDGKYKKWEETIPYSPDIFERDSQVPALTSNSSAGGLAFSQHGTAYFLFDGKSANGDKHMEVPSDKRMSSLWGYIFNTTTREKKKVKTLSLKRAGTTPAPKNVFIEVSDDTTTGLDGTWTTVYTTVLTSWAGYTWVDIELDKEVEAVAIRFRYSGLIVDNYSWMGIIEMTIYSDYYLAQPEIPYTPAHWETISNTLPKSTGFIDKGMNVAILDRAVTELEETFDMVNVTDATLSSSYTGVGKVFSNTIDLNKYMDIRKVGVD